MIDPVLQPLISQSALDGWRLGRGTACCGGAEQTGLFLALLSVRPGEFVRGDDGPDRPDLWERRGSALQPLIEFVSAVEQADPHSKHHNLLRRVEGFAHRFPFGANS